MTDSGAAATFTVNDAGGNTFSGLLSGALSLTKTGAGVLTLSHANTYSGPTTISAGTIIISADNNLGAAPASATPAALTINGGALATTASFTLNANRGISLGASGGTIDVAAGTTLAYNGIAAGTGGLTKIDTGALVLGGVNTYSGATTISAGIVSVVVSNVFGNTVRRHDRRRDPSWISAVGSASARRSPWSEAPAPRAAARLSVPAGPTSFPARSRSPVTPSIGDSAGQLTLSGAIGDNGLGYGLTLVGGGTFVLSGGSNNTYAGATTLRPGRSNFRKPSRTRSPPV